MARTALLVGLAAALATAGSVVVLAQTRRAGRDDAAGRPVVPAGKRAAGGLDRASALLAAAALADSAVEHYRGSFHNKAMYAPLAISSLTLAASVRDAAGGGGALPLPRAAVNGLALATGIVGTGFHLYNITKRPGGFGWLNLFYAAPLGAPAALSSGGIARNRGSPAAPRRDHALRAVAGRAGVDRPLRHRGRGRPPAFPRRLSQSGNGDPDYRRSRRRGAAGASRPGGASSPGQSRPALARWALRLLAGVGFAGSAFHAYGIQRNMGGWRNWSQNLLNGPPLPAPPAFTALAIAGLAALRLIEEQKDERAVSGL